MIQIVENELSVQDYMYLIETTGWRGILPKGEQLLSEALLNSWYTITAYEGSILIGCGRIVSDGHLHALLCDVIVDPTYQSKGVGSLIVSHLVKKCKEHNIVMIQLFSAKDKADFYEKNGFQRRAVDAPGMFYGG